MATHQQRRVLHGHERANEECLVTNLTDQNHCQTVQKCLPEIGSEVPGRAQKFDNKSGTSYPQWTAQLKQDTDTEKRALTQRNSRRTYSVSATDPRNIAGIMLEPCKFECEAKCYNWKTNNMDGSSQHACLLWIVELNQTVEWMRLEVGDELLQRQGTKHALRC